MSEKSNEKEKKENKNKKEKKEKSEKKMKKSLSEIFSIQNTKSDFEVFYVLKGYGNHIPLEEIRSMRGKMRHLQLKVKQLESANKFLYDIVKRIDKKSEKKSEKKSKKENSDENQYKLKYHPYINQIQDQILKYKMEDEGFRKRREEMEKDRERVNEFLLREMKNNENEIIREKMKQMDQNMNYQLEIMEENQKNQEKQIDFLLENYNKKMEKDAKKNSNIKKGFNIFDYLDNFNDDENDGENKDVKKNRVYPYKNSKRIFYEKEK